MARNGRLRPTDGLRAFALDQGAVLYSAPDQELHVLNATAAFLWALLAEGKPSSSLVDALARHFDVAAPDAGRWVEDQLADWRRRGWIAETSRPRDGGWTLREGQSRREAPAPRPTVTRTRLRTHGRVYRYRLLTTRFALVVPPGPAERQLVPVLAHLECDDDAPADVVLALEHEDGAYRLLEDGRPVRGPLAATELAPIVKLQMRNVTMNRHDYFMQIHAGAVLADDGVLLFPGMSGSGKTTLTASLAASGFGYLSDEVVLLERDSFAVRPFPLALTVKPGAVEPLSELYPGVAALDVHHREDGKRVRYLRPPSGAIVSDSDRGHPVRALIFPRYAPNAPASLRPVERCEALQRLLGSCLSLPEWLSVESVGKLVQWMRGLDCWELDMRSVSDAVTMVRQRPEAA